MIKMDFNDLLGYASPFNINRQPSASCDFCHRSNVPLLKSDVSNRIICIPCLVDIVSKFMKTIEDKIIKNKGKDKDGKDRIPD